MEIISNLKFMRKVILTSMLLVALSGNVLSDIFTVTNTNDNGAGSLRQAILDANANPGSDVIRVLITEGGPLTISWQVTGIRQDPYAGKDW